MGCNAPFCASWGAARFAAYHEASYHYSQALALYAMRDEEKAGSATGRMHAFANATACVAAMLPPRAAGCRLEAFPTLHHVPRETRRDPQTDGL